MFRIWNWTEKPICRHTTLSLCKDRYETKYEWAEWCSHTCRVTAEAGLTGWVGGPHRLVWLVPQSLAVLSQLVEARFLPVAGANFQQVSAIQQKLKIWIAIEPLRRDRKKDRCLCLKCLQDLSQYLIVEHSLCKIKSHRKMFSSFVEIILLLQILKMSFPFTTVSINRLV